MTSLRLFLATLGTSVLFAFGCDVPNAPKEKSAEKSPEKSPEKSASDSPSPQTTEPPSPKPIENSQTQEPRKPQVTNTNHLQGESSPYLLMHAQNPVDWYPWGAEALEKARRENKLIFLSVGYSSCHWCHVMEQESFVDEEIAALLNKHFVCIKVDREERPDIDKIYMTAVQYSQRGRGGWPMTVFLTPDAKPFYGATYLPARDNDRPGATGFLTLVRKLQDVWTKNADEVRKASTLLTEAVKAELEREFTEEQTKPEEPLDHQILNRVQRTLAEQFDPEHGGFGYSPTQPDRPKFPEPSNLVFLLHRIESKNISDKARTEAHMMLIASLDAMAAGGIYDHLGGGFHRYSVDRFWHIPHFEKMLYDNGQLASVYAEASRVAKNENYARVARGIADYILAEMTDEQGGFYAALDADSEHIEGKFYRWTPDEAKKLLSPDEYELFAEVYSFDGPPNFEEHFHVPMRSESLAQSAKKRNLGEQQLVDQLAPIRAKLLVARNQRVRPMTDTKILTSWNGLMIRGMADTGRLLNEPRYVKAAERAADFVLANLRNDDGRLLRTYGEGGAKLNAYLTDYAFLIDGLIALSQATDDPRWLKEADQLMQTQIKLFAHDNGGFYFTSHDHESLLARTGDAADNVQPSGNSISVANLLHLSNALDRPAYREQARKTIRASLGTIRKMPTSMPRMAVELDRFLESQEQTDEK